MGWGEADRLSGGPGMLQVWPCGKDRFCDPSQKTPWKHICSSQCPLHWNIPMMFFTQMPSRREAKGGFFSDVYALFSPCNFPIIFRFFSPCSTKNLWPFLFLACYFVLEAFLLICWKLPCGWGTENCLFAVASAALLSPYMFCSEVKSFCLDFWAFLLYTGLPAFSSGTFICRNLHDPSPLLQRESWVKCVWRKERHQHWGELESQVQHLCPFGIHFLLSAAAA